MTDRQQQSWADFVADIMRCWVTRTMDTKDMSEKTGVSEHICAMALHAGREEQMKQKATA